MERGLACANDLGLLSEAARPADGEAAGNTPPALTHVAAVNAALSIQAAGARVPAATGGSPASMTIGAVESVEQAYAPGEERPLGSYALLVTGFSATVAGTLALLERAGRRVPARFAADDVVLMALATHKISRIVAKDRVTSFLRAPFVRYQHAAGPSEVEEKARGTGLQLAVGELALCPYCLAPWVASGLFVGLVGAPRATRFIASVFAAVAASDALQLAYHSAQENL